MAHKHAPSPRAQAEQRPAERRAGRGRRPEARPVYDFGAIEARWRAEWERTGIYRPDLRNAPRPFYNLMMFPYPSAEGLHVGNMYSYIGSDVQGRWRAMQGYDVFEPIGFDAFGIHSENFAIRQGDHPRPMTARNIARFREQLQRIGNRFDWSHEVQTTDPRYYRWTQWIFVQLFKAGLAERRLAAVNWCPRDRTVLADEQVIAGRCERCDTPVERRELEQWFLKITRYADKLLEHLDRLDWSQRVIAAQRHWIGRSEGLEFDFAVAGHMDTRIPVYTTRPDTIYGATFVALAPDHPLADVLTIPEQSDAIGAYRAETTRARVTEETIAERPVSGVFTGAYAVHPLTGEHIPVWVADYVLSAYGTGAIMGVPAHDARDHAFAVAMGLPIRAVVAPAPDALPQASLPFTAQGVLVESAAYSGLTSAEAAARIMADFEAREMGRRAVKYHLRDWLISRQRYWGPPIPIIYCPAHGAVPVPEEQLPVLLPPLEDFAPTGTGASPLARVSEFVNTTCPICGGPARRETDVSDNFLDSAWYFLRYPSSDDEREPWDPALTHKWLPAGMYIGGAEHSVLHLLYARFITMALHDLGYLEFEEPFAHFRANGRITYAGGKMSKSRGNIVSPDTYIERYGADAFRTYMLFMGPYEAGGEFSDRGLGGAVRFLNRVWQFVTERAGTARAQTPTGTAERVRHTTIRQVTDDIEALKYNTAIAALMKYLNALEAQPAVTRAEIKALLLLLAPFAPFISEELWERIGGGGSVHTRRWPEADTSAMRAWPVEVVVQVNGRMRDRITVAADLDEEDIKRRALEAPNAQRYIAGHTVARVVHVPGRLVNIVVEE